MKLIDADKLILHLNDYALQEAPFRGESADAYNAIKQCIEAVEAQPTAYDVDKVICSLEEQGYTEVMDDMNPFEPFKVVNLDKAKEIIMGGETCIFDTSADECEIRKQSYNKALEDFKEAIDEEDREEPLVLDMFAIEEIADKLKK